MRTKLLLIAVSLILGADAIAQKPDQCLPPPVFCTKMTLNNAQLPNKCEDAINAKYLDLLKTAINNWNVLDYKFNFNPDTTGGNAYPFGEPGEPYNRCLEQNSGKIKESKDFFQLRSDVIVLSEPLPIEGSKLYLNENQQNYKCMANKEPYLAELGEIIGRLEIKYQMDNVLVSQVTQTECPKPLCNHNSIKNDDPKANYAQWGTVIKLFDNVVLTSCHVLESLVDKNGNLSLDSNNEKLVVDFGERTDRFDYHQQEVKSILWYSQNEGYDLALLELVPPPPLQQKQKSNFMNSIIWGKPSDPNGNQEVAVIGYPDFHHFLDPCAEAAFDPYKTQGDAKFVSLGCAFPPPPDKCGIDPESKKDPVLFKTLFHTATTTMGESGSILVARNVGHPTIIGVHICCSYPQANQYTAPPSKLKCANVKRTQYNQAISVCSLLELLKNDPKLPGKLNALGLKLDTIKNECGGSSATAKSQKQAPAH